MSSVYSLSGLEDSATFTGPIGGSGSVTQPSEVGFPWSSYLTGQYKLHLAVFSFPSLER